MRVLRIYHGAVVDEYRERERTLRERHGHDVHVVCPPAWEEGGGQVALTADSDVPVHPVRVYGRNHPNLFWYRPCELRAVMRAVKPDINDLHEEPYSIAAAVVLWAARKEAPDAAICVYSAQNLSRQYPPPFCWIERRVLGVARAAYPCSTEAGDRLVSRGFAGRVNVLPLGVSVPDPAERSAGPVKVGFVGRLEPYKGAMIALRAYLAAAAGTDAILEVIGDGSQAGSLREMAARSELADRISFTGALPQRETLERISQLDILLVPSLTTATWKEQFGRVAAQAMVAGVAVIASDSGSLREVVSDAGILVPESDLEAFTVALRGLVNDPSRRAELSRLGRKRASEHFSWEAVADATDEMYRQMSQPAVELQLR